jgi:ABC-type dipeptide/oligopeptide/nickel transport system permease component
LHLPHSLSLFERANRRLATDDEVVAMRTVMGLDRPLLEQDARYLIDVSAGARRKGQDMDRPLVTGCPSESSTSTIGLVS